MTTKETEYSAVTAAAWRQTRPLLIFSFLVNFLLLITAIYMLQVYDRVLSSGSLDTLLWLTVVALFAIAVYAFLEQARRLILGRIGDWLDSELTGSVVRHTMEAHLGGAKNDAGPRDVRDIRAFVSGDGVLAFLDAPWTLVFIAFIWLLHPALGVVATVGALVLFACGLLNDRLTRKPRQEADAVLNRSFSSAIRYIDSGETIRPLGMAVNLINRWQARQKEAREAKQRYTEKTTSILSLSRGIRLSLQILILGIGAFFVLDGQLTAGAMIAASIVLARALAPIERSIGAWHRFIAARGAHDRLKKLFDATGDLNQTLELPRPMGKVSVENVSYFAPQSDMAILRDVTFALEAGQTCAIVGPSGSGKSSLCRLLLGAWRPYAGHVRLDGADVYSWDSEQLGHHIGYLPQQVELFPGTVAENIARFGTVDSEKVVAAAELAGVHELILGLPNGYECDVGVHGSRISLGQRQRIGLARALFDDPSFIVLDEPNSNLDNDGDQALMRALAHLKSNQRTVIIVTHRPAALQTADKVLLMREGRVANFGDRDVILRPVLGATAPLRSDAPRSPEHINQQDGAAPRSAPAAE